jgi:hypothetical protein
MNPKEGENSSSGPNLKNIRKQRKAAVTRELGNISRFIAEEDIDEVKSREQKLKDTFKRFELSHDAYHETLEDENEIDESEQYYYEAQNVYIKAIKDMKAWLRANDSENLDRTANSEILNTTSPSELLNTSRNQTSIDIVNAINTPRFEIEKFSGDPMKYFGFISMFEECVESVVTDPKMRLTRLINATLGDVKKAIEPCQSIKDGLRGYIQARKILENRFGNDHLIFDSVVSSLKKCKQIKAANDLQSLADQLSNSYEIICQMGKLSEIDSQNFLLEIVQKLQPFLQSKWRKQAVALKRATGDYPNLKMLVDFVRENSDEMNDPVYGKMKLGLKDNSNSDLSERSKSQTTNFSSDVKVSQGHKVYSCILCKGAHKLFYCDSFKGMKPLERLKFVRDNRLCDNCLLPNHQAAACRRQSVCSVPGCGKKHTKYIHIPSGIQGQSMSNGAQRSANNGSPVTLRSHVAPDVVNANVGDEYIFMPVVSVVVNGSNEACALLDTASSGTFCTRSLVNSLGIQGKEAHYSLSTLSGKNVLTRTETVELYVASRDGTSGLLLSNVLVVDDIPGRTLSSALLSQYSHLHNLQLVEGNKPIDILIGQDNTEALLPLEVRRGAKGEPFASLTLFGWTINGPSKLRNVVGHHIVSHFISSVEQQIHNLWKLDFDGIDDYSLSNEDKRVLKLWDANCTKVDGHFEIPIPWRDNVQMPNNVSLALTRLKSLKSSISKKGIASQYNAEITKLLDKGYAEPVPCDRLQSSDVWYLPHHAVVNPRKPDKFRIVYDCAAEFLGESLNDKCFRGPDMNNNLLHVLLRFRQHHFAFCADVEAMYYQVLIPAKERDCLRFLWFDECGDIAHYRMTRHVFGGVWCASSSAYALRKTLSDCSDVVDPLVKDTIQKSFYVDDCLKSCASEQDAHLIIEGTRSVLSRGGFNLTKFIANEAGLLTLVPQSHWATEGKDLGGDCSSKTLGVKWDVTRDLFYFEADLTNQSCEVTKRNILKITSSVFDPLGLISPILLTGKLIFQDVTRLQLAWDDPAPVDVCDKWTAWLQDLQRIGVLQFIRCLKPLVFNGSAMQLHHFSDASQRAFGCCTYLRCVNSQGQISVMLVMSKGRLAPLKSVTIPRLELQAALLAAQIDAMLRSQLELDLLESCFWVDSEIVLKYIKNETRRFHVFVGNRVSVIRDLTKPSQWKHVLGSENPADLLTREQSVHSLDHDKWFHGPKFLHTFKSDWEEMKYDVSLSSDDPEVKSDPVVKKSSCVTAFIAEQEDPVVRLSERYSNWVDLKRATAWMLRLRKLLHKDADVSSGPLTLEETRLAGVFLIKWVQGRYFSTELLQLQSGKAVNKSSRLRDLDPILDSEGVICVGGRLRRAALLSYKHPYIIPHEDHMADIIVREMHEISHQGVEWTLSYLRRQFWITKARSKIKRLISSCVVCKKLRGKPLVQKMADLPEVRVQPNKPPFSAVGVDCFGPFYVKIGRSEVKRYGCIFTCLSSRAIHLEKICNMDTDSFINALRRFISRRGPPEKIYSDNGTNFVGAKVELEKNLQQINELLVQRFCLKKKIDWTFNPPGASHMGGSWERMIRTVRQVLNGLFNIHARLSDDMLDTLFCEVENIVNSRPITKVSDSADDLDPLTPNHILLLRNCPPVSPGHFCESDLYRRRWRVVQQLADTFWRRWLREYLPELQKRSKWQNLVRNVKVNDVVLVLDESTPRGLWPMGIVTQVITSEDQLVRSVRVRTKASTFLRPLSKIVLLEGV